MNNTAKQKPKQEKTYKLETTLGLTAIIFFILWKLILRPLSYELASFELFKAYAFYLFVSWILTEILIASLTTDNRSASNNRSSSGNRSASTSSSSSTVRKGYTPEQWNKKMNDLLRYHDKCTQKVKELSDQKRYLLTSAYNMDTEYKRIWIEEIDDELNKLDYEIRCTQGDIGLLRTEQPR